MPNRSYLTRCCPCAQPWAAPESVLTISRRVQLMCQNLLKIPGLDCANSTFSSPWNSGTSWEERGRPPRCRVSLLLPERWIDGGIRRLGHCSVWLSLRGRKSLLILELGPLMRCGPFSLESWESRGLAVSKQIVSIRVEDILCCL